MRDRKRSRFFPDGGIGDRSPGGLQKKLSDTGGLTVIEMLCATCILILLCMMLATGLSMATYQYRMLTAEAETELLVNSIVSALSDRLRENKLTVTVPEGGGDGSYSYSIGEITTAQGNTYAGTTAPAMGTVILEKNVPLKDGELVAPLKVVSGSGAGEATTILPVGTRIAITGATATAALPGGGSISLNPAGAVIIQQRALLPDGAYGAALNKEGGAEGKKRRYHVQSGSLTVSASVTKKDGTKQDLASGIWPASLNPDDVAAVSYTIKLTVEDQVTHVVSSTPDDGIVVRCLNPVK